MRMLIPISGKNPGPPSISVIYIFLKKKRKKEKTIEIFINEPVYKVSWNSLTIRELERR
jgi:hypothetical protein